MPFKSEAQRRLMMAVAHDKELAKSTGISQRTAREFIKKDEAKHQKKDKK